MALKLTNPAVIVLGLVTVIAAGTYAWTAYDSSKNLQRKRGFVTASLKDPESAQFRNERVTKNNWVCGELNTKNSYGAFIGFKRYISGDQADAYIEEIGIVGKSGDSFNNFSTNADLFIAFLEIKAEHLEGENEARKTGATIPTAISERTAMDLAFSKVFEKKWKEICS